MYKDNQNRLKVTLILVNPNKGRSTVKLLYTLAHKSFCCPFVFVLMEPFLEYLFPMYLLDGNAGFCSVIPPLRTFHFIGNETLTVAERYVVR